MRYPATCRAVSGTGNAPYALCVNPDGERFRMSKALARADPTKVKEYHVYIIDADGHILQRCDLFCADDGAAKEQAKQLVDGHDVELWQLDRQIATFKNEQ
jgi:hypothetical protein